MTTSPRRSSKTERRRIKIKNEITGRMLSTKIDAQLAIAGLLPQLHFDVG